MNKLEQLCSELCIMDIKYREKINLPKNVKFGTEIEFENACYNDVLMMIKNKKKLSEWILKDDTTVSMYYEGKYYGGEFVSPILRDTKQTWSNLKNACQLLRQNLAFNQGKSGAHIHVDSNILKDNDNFIINLVKLWTVYEHIIYRFSFGENIEPRKTLLDYASPNAPYYNEFLKSYLKDKKAFDYKLFDIKLNRESKLYYLLADVHNLEAIRGGICFHHCKGISNDEINTIEFRCPNGTVNHIIWQNNINFFTKLLIYCASSNFDNELINKKLNEYEYKRLEQYSDIYLSDATELSNLIFDCELDKMYFLKQYLKINKYNFEIVKEKSLKR